ncbi:MAG: iron-containing alcohol dehydrogenase [Acidobacteria bacterium]|nr:iron-containing alcohol dehydrogenase [Acidobacteriota bacterium]
MQPFDFQLHTQIHYGAGKFKELGAAAGALNFRRTLLVSDQGLMDSGYVDEAIRLLKEVGVEAFVFHDFEANPNTRMVEAGRDFASSLAIDSLIGLGGGSSMDCAKGINFLLTNGGAIRDYKGYGKAAQALLPMIAIPTTAGTGSEAQCYALIADADTHEKMACGDPKAAFRVALLDPILTVSQPVTVTATAGFDAISHAVESYVTTRRNALSEMYAREAWRLLEANYERVLADPHNLAGRGAMQLGAYFAGVAIENSMLGATHACANPLTAHYGTAHGEAIAVMLPSVVRWNSALVAERYGELLKVANIAAAKQAGEALAARLEQLIEVGQLPQRLSQVGIKSADLKMLAEDAARQWTGTFNPRPFGASEALEMYRCAY